jgi:uncharacterized protein (DUF488 family)
MASRIVSVGYEGRDVDSFVTDLAGWGVGVLVDVRLNAVSRRRGFSKTKLREALTGAGIEYLHLRALGNPKDNRAPFHRGRADQGRAVYVGLVEQSPQAQDALDDLVTLTGRGVVAVMCFEADEDRCHRQVVTSLVAERAGTAALAR